MDQEVKQLLEENLKISKENNELLLKVRNVQRWSQITRGIYLFFIIGAAIGAFYFIQPFFDSLLSVYGVNSSDIGNVFK